MEGASNPIALAGVCLGLEGEAKAAVELVASVEPAVVALGLDPLLVDHLDELGEGSGGSLEDEAYERGLGRWGDVALPGPEFPALVDAAREASVRVEGVDLDEASYLERYTAEVGILDLVRRGLRTRRLRKRPPRVETPEAFCRAFDERLNKGAFAHVEALRERHMATETLALSEEGSVVLVVEVQRLDGVTAALLDQLGPSATVRRR